MIPTVKSVTRDNFPFRRLLRSEKPTRNVFTTIAARTNENDLVSLQYRNALLSIEDMNVLADAQEEYTSSGPHPQADQAYAALPSSADQISFDFIKEMPQVEPAAIPVAIGQILNEET